MPGEPPSVRKTSLPLDGIRVLDVTEFVAGPTASLLLGAMGAEVIKVERIYLADHRPMFQVAPPPKPGVPDEPWNRVPWFNELNRGKLSVALNLAAPEGVALFKRLVRLSDVVMNNFSPRVMRNFGLEYTQLRAENPEVIAVSMSGFGADGPWRDWIAAGPNIDAVSGIAHLTGYPGGGPMRPGNFNPDLMAGLFSAFGTLAALEHRAQTGEGQHVDLSMLEAGLQFIGEAVAGYSGDATVASRTGNGTPGAAPSGCYPCREPDTWITIVIRTDAEWQRLGEAMEEATLLEDPRFADSLSRLRHRDGLDRLLAQWTSRHPYLELSRSLTANGLAVGAVKTPADLLQDPHLQDREFVFPVDLPQVANTVNPRFGWLFSDLALRLDVPAPVHGQHTRVILETLLGLPEQEVLKLQEANVTVTKPVDPYRALDGL